MIKAVDISINKTSQRIAEFENNPEISGELLETLSSLHQIKSNLLKDIK